MKTNLHWLHKSVKWYSQRGDFTEKSLHYRFGEFLEKILVKFHQKFLENILARWYNNFLKTLNVTHIWPHHNREKISVLRVLPTEFVTSCMHWLNTTLFMSPNLGGGWSSEWLINREENRNDSNTYYFSFHKSQVYFLKSWWLGKKNILFPRTSESINRL